MTTILPPLPPQPPSGGPAGATVATAVNPPPALAQLARGAGLEGVVMAQIAKNQLQVQTALGIVTLQTAIRVPVGAVLTLVVSQTASQSPSQISPQAAPHAQGGIQLNITGVDGRPPGPGQATGPQAPIGGAQPPRIGSGTDLRPALAPGLQTGATLLRPGAGVMAGHAHPVAQASTVAGNTTGQAQRAPGGGDAGGRASPHAAIRAGTGNNPGQAAAGRVPAGGGQSSPATPSPGAPVAGGNPTVAGAAQQATAGGTIPAGSRFSVEITKVEQPATGAARSEIQGTPHPARQQPGIARGNTISGTVTGATTGGKPIVSAPQATIAIDARVPATGTRVSMEIITDAQAPRPQPAASAMTRLGSSEMMIKSPGWENLDEAIKLVATADPPRAGQVRQNIPRPGVKLGAQMLFFLSALRGGDIRSWLGESVSRLVESERPGLMQRLNSDFQVMAKLADEPSSGDWRMAMIPILNDDKVERIRLYQRRAKRNSSDDNDDNKRFVLDFSLSQMGHMQIDGLVSSDNSRLDIIIRTDAPLPDNAKIDIAAIYNEAAELTGIGGGLSFQSAPANFIEFSSPSGESETGPDNGGLIA